MSIIIQNSRRFTPCGSSRSSGEVGSPYPGLHQGNRPHERYIAHMVQTEPAASVMPDRIPCGQIRKSDLKRLITTENNIKLDDLASLRRLGEDETTARPSAGLHHRTNLQNTFPIDHTKTLSASSFRGLSTRTICARRELISWRASKNLQEFGHFWQMRKLRSRRPKQPFKGPRGVFRLWPPVRAEGNDQWLPRLWLSTIYNGARMEQIAV